MREAAKLLAPNTTLVSDIGLLQHHRRDGGCGNCWDLVNEFI